MRLELTSALSPTIDNKEIITCPRHAATDYTHAFIYVDLFRGDEIAGRFINAKWNILARKYIASERSICIWRKYIAEVAKIFLRCITTYQARCNDYHHLHFTSRRMNSASLILRWCFMSTLLMICCRPQRGSLATYYSASIIFLLAFNHREIISLAKSYLTSLINS